MLSEKFLLNRGLGWWQMEGDLGIMFAVWSVRFKFSYWKCWKLSCTKNRFLHISFDLAMLHYCWATHSSTVQHCAAMLAWCERKDFPDINTTKTLSGVWLEAKWLFWQVWWWKSDGGQVVEAAWLHFVCCGKTNVNLVLRVKLLCMP